MAQADGSAPTVQAMPTEERVVVQHGGKLLADSVSPVVLRETGCPDRYYLPETDVFFDALESSSTTSSCPFKGTADRYWSVRGDEGARDIAWSYSNPLPEVAAIRGRIAFYNVNISVDPDIP